ncbi:excinuclease ABC subunit UvrC [Lentimicrobium sp.]|jgi:excinuclease ABC subunit C|uniref:excinuclease ABC subunit UvrC n=1 Tax=Lentimicrobium sp. TaxID=2034841 RepID=UPI0025D0C16A|nr:excinuclease ABC subunit UvrC [Lentimicrobium sp.]MCO5256713.1 excinuclease ABC subunit UvrC [Lentimicrobium sp.]MCO5263036.1 excinuclease ABC subunit UvrC [Lentimicrobium sp.]HOP12680.1 excinuclease ABC subunit UvrC [Lentimicrobium sp.]HPF64879.1 excinuclease ABC subunit UvrC [Lentimicrobium sp.]HPJ61951.1 excinuclease ABC subunit UvrC [Lentimicrobium sp.]
MPAESISKILKTLPSNPGVYQYFDKEGRIIYIGKAKNLKKRVMSYFNKDASLTGKVRVLVSKIADIRWIVVDSEYDALLLENNLIKEYQPRYNIMLKDDKTYPWICIKKEPFPRVFPTRNLVKDGSEYFGPYASVKMMNTLLDLVRQLYPLRNCSLNLGKKQIEAGKYKVCLEYHIGNCLGPCEGLQSEEDYMETIRGIRSIIRGNIGMVRNQLHELMKQHADAFAFEKAQIIKEKIELLDRFQSKSLVVNPSINNVDVFSIIEDAQAAYVNFVKVASGAIIQSHTVELKKKLDETTEELLSLAIADLHPRFTSGATEIIVPLMPEFQLPGITYTVPQRGDKKQLLELSERNAKYYQLDKQRQKELVDPERRVNRILDTIKKDLGLKEQPLHMECFDNSNIQGSFPVAALVVFRHAKPEKKDYRHFNIKTVEGPNDFASMEEVVYRRYSRLLEEGSSLPQVVIIDGGKGQLSSAMTSIQKLGLQDKIQLIGIAKKLEELYFPGDPLPLHLDKKSETLKVIQQMRDEAHRFGITHHRKRREKGTIKTSLSDIGGIGSATAQTLLRKFKSVKNIRSATLDELKAAIGNNRAEIVYAHFAEEKEKKQDK